DIFKK
ncbi:TPA: complexin-1, partial [Bos taurus]